MTLPRRALLATLLAAPAAAPPVAAPAKAQDRAAPAPRPDPLPPPQSRTHTLVLADRTLRFTTTAGSVTLTDPQGAPQAAVGFIAYTLDGAEPARRPVTFALNGGPGASSAWLHLGAIGPWRLDMQSAAPSAPAHLRDNEETWLDFTDLVFIDPVGAGYSRFLAAGDDLRKRVWSVAGDIESIAGAIRRWLVQAGRMASPKLLVGESYGGFRGPRLARTLAQSHGVGLSGLVLLSPVLDFGGRSNAMDPLYWAAALPTLAAAARHASSRADLADAEAYAAGDYLADLLRGAEPTATARRSARVAALTGLDPALVRRHGGMIDGPIYMRSAPPGRLASLYDLDVTLPDPDPTSLYGREPDAVLDTLRAPFTAAMLDLYATRLGWKLDAPYELLNEAVNRAWDWGGGRTAAEAMSHLRSALALDPGLRVVVAHGLTDVVTPYFRTALLLDTIEPTAGRDRVTLHAWPGGHMFYSRDAGRAALRTAAARLYP
jgi:carboxypeptidase C (cathepsin A)